MDYIEHVLTCSICIELFEKPRLLPCQHTFCEKCLSDYINSNTKNKSKTKPSFVCPLCRANTALGKQPFSGEEFPANLTIQSLLDSKELMKAIEKKKLPTAIGAASGVMSKIKKKLLTRSKATQTENEDRTRQTNLIRLKSSPNKRKSKENRPSTVVDENDFCSQYFSFQNVPNFYQLALQKLIGPLLSTESRRLRKVMTVFMSIVSVLMYLILVLFAFVFEWEYILMNISVMSIVTEMVFVRLKCDITLIKNRLYAVAGFSLAYAVTVYIYCILFLFLRDFARKFVLYQKHGFHLVAKSIFTHKGLENVLVREFNTTLDIDDDTKRRELIELHTDFIVLTNVMIKEGYINIYVSIQQNWQDILVMFGVIIIVQFCVERMWSFIRKLFNQ